MPKLLSHFIQRVDIVTVAERVEARSPIHLVELRVVLPKILGERIPALTPKSTVFCMFVFSKGHIIPFV
jgi:hypothetical protein